MIERRGRPPGRCCMTALTFLAYCGIMPVSVAIGTGLRKPKIRLPSGFLYECKNVRVLDILYGMAILAPNCCMLPRPVETCLRMIERILVELNRFRITAEMFLVTRHALLRSNSEVIPALRIDC